MPAKRGARNPKVTSFSVRLDDRMNARLEQLADAAGANKGTMAAMAIAAGLNLLEGAFIKQEETIEQAGERILEYVIKVASGETEVAAVRHKQNDFIPWKRGVSL